MLLPTQAEYSESRPRFLVTRDLAQRALDWAQPLAMAALGIHTRRQTLVDGALPAYVVMTTPESNGGWGELMPLWFKPYERPVPYFCLDNWTLFALLYRSAFGPDADTSAFTIEHLVRVVIGADLLIPFLPSTEGLGRFLRHGALPILLSIYWLEPDVRAAWLSLHVSGARRFVAGNERAGADRLSARLERIERDAWLAAEHAGSSGRNAVGANLVDGDRWRDYAMLFGGLCLSVSALAESYDVDWRRWVFQAVNVAYRLPQFGVKEIAAWLGRM